MSGEKKMSGVRATKIIIWTIVLVVLLGVLIYGIVASDNVFRNVFQMSGWDNGFNFTIGSGYLGEDAEKGLSVEKKGDEVSGIVLDFTNEDIKVLKSSDHMIRIEQTSAETLPDEQVMRFGVRDGKLIAQSGLIGKNFIGMKQHSTITLHVPEGYSYELNFDTSSGRVDVDGGNYGMLEIDTASGEITVKNVAAKAFELDSTSGRVTLDSSTADWVDISTTSGEITALNVTTKTMNFDSTSGRIIASGSTELFEANTMSGEVEVEFSGLRKFDADTTSGEITITCNDAQNLESIEADSVSGAVHITLPENRGFEVDFNSISGDLHNQFEMVEDTHKNGEIEISVDTTSGALDILKK